MLCWAGNFIVGRWSAGQIPPITLSFLRWTGAAILLLPFAWPYLRRDWPVIRRNFPILIGLVVIGTGLFNSLQYIALNGTTATNGSIINSTSPVMIAVISYFLGRERLGGLQCLGISISLVGVLCLVARGELSNITELSFYWGDLVMLGAMLMWAVYTILLDKRPPISALGFACFTYLGASVLNAGLAGAELAAGARIIWSTEVIMAIAYVTIFPSLIAYLCYNRGVEILGPTRAGVFMHLVPLFTMGFAVAFLGEQLALYQLAGLVLILAGVWFAAFDKPA